MWKAKESAFAVCCLSTFGGLYIKLILFVVGGLEKWESMWKSGGDKLWIITALAVSVYNSLFFAY